jgi:hypothetical protein
MNQKIRQLNKEYLIITKRESLKSNMKRLYNKSTTHDIWENCTTQGDCLDRVHSDQMVLGTVGWEAGPQERQPKAFKTKLAQKGPSGLSPLRSDGFVVPRREARPP